MLNDSMLARQAETVIDGNIKHQHVTVIASTCVLLTLLCILYIPLFFSQCT